MSKLHKPAVLAALAISILFSQNARSASVASPPPSQNLPVDAEALDCRPDLALIDHDLDTNPAMRSRLELLILKARLLRDNRTIKGARKEGLKSIDDGISSAHQAEIDNPGVSWPWAMEGMLDLLKTQYLHFPAGMHYGKLASRANNQALALEPDDPEANLSRGLEDYYKPWFVGGSYVKAEKRFRKALAKAPKDPRILSWNGLADLALDREEKGFREIKEAAGLCPGNPIYQKRLLTRRPR